VSRRGFALAGVLFALTVLGVVAATGLFAALHESRSAQQSLSVVRARQAARAAVSSVLAGWDAAALNTLAPGSAAAVVVPQTPGVTSTARVHRLGPRWFMIRGSASAAQGVSTRLDQVVRLEFIETAPAAVRTRVLDPGLAGHLDGADRAPPGWVCPATTDTVAAQLVQPGAPDEVFFQFGRRSWAEVAAWAAAAPAGGDSLPVRYAPGDLTLTAERVTGAVVVGGDLVLAAGAEIVGLALVRGVLRLDGLGGRIIGLAVASQIVTQNGFTPSGTVVDFSSCAALAAMLSRAVPDPTFGTHSGFLY